MYTQVTGNGKLLEMHFEYAAQKVKFHKIMHVVCFQFIFLVNEGSLNLWREAIWNGSCKSSAYTDKEIHDIWAQYEEAYIQVLARVIMYLCPTFSGNNGITKWQMCSSSSRAFVADPFWSVLLPCICNHSIPCDICAKYQGPCFV